MIGYFWNASWSKFFSNAYTCAWVEKSQSFNSAESSRINKGKNVIIGEDRPEKKMQQNKTSRDLSALGGQNKKKANNKSTGLTDSNGGPTGLTGAKTGLTGTSNESGGSFKSKTRPTSARTFRVSVAGSPHGLEWT